MTDQEQQPPDNPETPADAPRVDLGASVVTLVNAVAKGIEEELEPYSLTSVEFSLLSYCYEKDECTATELASVLPVDPPRVSRMVTALADRGLLRRRRLRNDRRVVMLRLSDDGAELAATLRRSIGNFYISVAQGISAEDLGVFASVTDKIADNYAAMQQSE
ncbi:MAG: MarR family winged helix-turn-helix transcriptional regulator [Chloroflexi bacterium]|nr:MarR family winged helix-turn-helix transcriptional regulator [Chloroflexota bacterium]